MKKYDGETRICHVCKQEKHKSEFAHRGGHSPYLRSICVECDKKRVVAQNERRATQILAIKAEAMAAGCKVCGEQDPVVLEFHHRDPKTRSFREGRMNASARISIPRLLEELQKCDVLCANCHLREHNRLRPNDG